MWNCKTLKLQKNFPKFDPEFENFKSTLPQINGVKCTWCVQKSCSLSYKKTLKCQKIRIGYDLKLFSFLKTKH